jgi:hypothetical protein
VFLPLTLNNTCLSWYASLPEPTADSPLWTPTFEPHVNFTGVVDTSTYKLKQDEFISKAQYNFSAFMKVKGYLKATTKRPPFVGYYTYYVLATVPITMQPWKSRFTKTDTPIFAHNQLVHINGRILGVMGPGKIDVGQLAEHENILVVMVDDFNIAAKGAGTSSGPSILSSPQKKENQALFKRKAIDDVSPSPSPAKKHASGSALFQTKPVSGEPGPKGSPIRHDKSTTLGAGTKDNSRLG